MSGDRESADSAPRLIPPSPPPVSSTGAIPWLRRNLFGSLASSLLTLISIAAILLVVPLVFEWAVLNSVWNARSLDECNTIIAATHGEGASGACWAVINERKWQLLFGFYPSDLYWRPTLALVLLLVAVAPVMFTALPRRMLWFSALYPFVAYALIWGISEPGNETLSTYLGVVHSARIGGFLLVIIVAVIGIAASIPVGIVLELSRRSSPFAFGPICMAVIEVFRGVPPILLLFAASIILNYFLPPGATFDLVLRVALVLALISGIYISEAIRANFAALPWGQYEAAAAMGLNYRSAMRLIIWPQVLNNSLPRIMIASTGLIRDISVLSIIGMIEPIRMLNVIRADADWNGIKCEIYLAVALGYGLISFAISRYALYLDNRLDPAHRGRTWLDWR